MAVKKNMRRRRRAKGEGRPPQQFIQPAPGMEAEGNSYFIPAGQAAEPSLRVSRAGEPQEVEADRTADRVVRQAPAESAIKATVSPIAAKGKDGSVAPSGAAPSAGTGGSPLPRGAAREMSAAFGRDFGNVRIHTDAAAQTAAKQLGAQAFTYRGNIYFAKGKYDPASKEGKWLLAHELTHVVQQRNGEEALQKKDVAEISTPVPKGMTVEKDDAGDVTGATGTMSGMKVIILPDTTGPVPAGKSGETKIDYSSKTPDSWESSNGKTISKIIGKAGVEVTLQTIYGEGVDPKVDSAYGRGTTKQDKKDKNTSLRFHEGSHGTFFFAYIKKHPIPTFGGRVGQTIEAYEKAEATYQQKLSEYFAALHAANEKAVDCVGIPEASCPVP
ncbi:eCIS core domain-containing protein [Chitinophaga lutea]